MKTGIQRFFLAVSTLLLPLSVQAGSADSSPAYGEPIEVKSNHNHETDEASIPIGLGFDTLVKWGKLPIKVGVEFYNCVESDDNFGGGKQIRFLFIPVLPSPECSCAPFFD